MSPVSAWSIALVTRLRTIRSTRRTSASARQGCCGARTTDLGRRAGRPAAAVMSTTRWATSTRLTSSMSSTAAPASNRLISSRSTSSVSNRSSSVCSSSAARAVAGSKSLARVVQHVAGHPHRGERRAQLVGDVGDEPPLHPAQLLELADLALQAGRHLVERRGQPGEVVLAGDPQPLLELAGGQPLGDPPGQPDRGDHLPGDQPGQPGDQHQQQHGGGEQRLRRPGRASPAPRSAGTGSRACRSGRRPAARTWEPTTIPGSVSTSPSGVLGGDLGVGPGGAGRLVEVLLQRRGTLVGVQAGGGHRAAVGDPAAGLRRPGRRARR